MTRRRIACLLTVPLIALLVGAAPRALAAPGPPNAPEWWFDTWKVPSLWNAGARGQGITIAEIDTGVSANLPELAGRILTGTDFGPAGGDGRTDHSLDDFGHGTAMASIMVAHPGVLGITGLAPDAQVLPVAVPLRGTNDVPTNNSGDHLADAIRWSANHGAKIVSMSLGGSREPAHDQLPCPVDEQNAITYAISKGAIVVAAAGNSGQKGSPVEEPGVCLGVISVGAVNSKGVVAPFSSRHKYLTVTAPGVNIPSLGRLPNHGFAGDGTSQATAITSAALALIWSKYPALSGRQVVSRLLATLDRRTATRDPAYGFGIVNAGRAITASVPANAPNPVYAAIDPFVAVAKAPAQRLAAPPAAGAHQAPSGQFVVGEPPGTWSSRVWTGVAVGVAGALALAVLTVVGIRRSRQHAAMPPDVALSHALRRFDGGYPPIPTYRDEAGLVWHDLTPPEDAPS